MAANVQPQLNRLRLDQAYFQWKFHRYRNGLTGDDVSLEEIASKAADGDAISIARRADIFSRLAHLPRNAIYDFTPAHQTRLRTRANINPILFRNFGGAETLANLQRPPTDAQDRVKENLNNFRNLLRLSFRYIKCLGWGGEGVVSLWRYRPDRNRDRLVVFKAVLVRGGALATAAQNIDRERDMMTVGVTEPRTSPPCVDNFSPTDVLSCATYCTAILPRRQPCNGCLARKEKIHSCTKYGGQHR